MSDRKELAPKDVREAKRIKLLLAVASFGGALAVALHDGSTYLATLFVGAGCLLLDVPIVNVIRAVRGKNGNGA